MDQYLELFKKAMKSIEDFWSTELSRELYKHPAKIAKLRLLESNVEEHWGKSMQQFRAALVEFYKVHKEVQKIYERGQKL